MDKLINRRSALAALSATAGALAAAPAAAALSAPSAPHESVALLLDMEQQLKAVLAQERVAYQESDRTGRLARAAYGRPPAWRAASDSMHADRRYERAKERFAARVRRIDEETGYAEAKRALESIRRQRDEIDVWRVKAVDIAGLKVKARIAALGRPCSSVEQDILDLVA